jgi:hypothetical protein
MTYWSQYFFVLELNSWAIEITPGVEDKPTPGRALSSVHQSSTSKTLGIAAQNYQ